MVVADIFALGEVVDSRSLGYHLYLKMMDHTSLYVKTDGNGTQE